MFGLVVAVIPLAFKAPAYSSAMIWLSGKSAEPTTREVAPPEAPALDAGAFFRGSDDPPQADSATARPSPAARPVNARLPRRWGRLFFMTYLLVQQSPQQRVCEINRSLLAAEGQLRGP